MGDDDIREETFSYYNERASEHDLVYLGIGPAIHQYADEYAKDVARIKAMVSQFGSGRAIDIACGTGFWAPYYAPNCSHVTFLDQSAAMLAECKRRIGRINLAEKLQFVQADFFDVDLEASSFDCALVGFLLSHFLSKHEERFFVKLNQVLKLPAQLMIIDSAWSEKRQKHRQKSGIEERLLEDGRRFRVYKRYFERSEIDELFGRYGYSCKERYDGNMLFAAIAGRIR